MTTNTDNTHAIVIGGSMAGLMSARVLSDHFDQVTIIERDTLPDDSAYRSGTPQARHLHALLIKGEQTLAQLFPGFVEEIEQEGARREQWGLNTAIMTTGGWVPEFDARLTGHAMSRSALEAVVRRRVRAIANVTFVTETEVRHLLTTADRCTVTGVALRSRADNSESDLSGNLVVDATGRKSRTPQWLESIGYDAPPETIIDAGTGYATRWYQDEGNIEKPIIVMQPRADEGLYRGGGLLHTEGGRFVVTLLGANDDYPPTDEAAFTEFARSLSSQVLYEAITNATPISPIYGYRGLENRLRHYEQIDMPENFVVTGDSYCGFNPIYGQGMTIASLEVVAMGDMLANRDVRDLRGFGAAYHKRLRQIIKPAWLMATTEDLRYPDVRGAKPDMRTRLMQKYFDHVAHAMAHDTVVTRRFFQAMNLLGSPSMLLGAPHIALRVAYHSLVHRRQPSDLRMTQVVQAVE